MFLHKETASPKTITIMSWRTALNEKKTGYLGVCVCVCGVRCRLHYNKYAHFQTSIIIHINCYSFIRTLEWELRTGRYSFIGIKQLITDVSKPMLAWLWWNCCFGTRIHRRPFLYFTSFYVDLGIPVSGWN